jgi:hypothetical protein
MSMPSIVMLPLRALRKRKMARDKVDFPSESQYIVDVPALEE